MRFGNYDEGFKVVSLAKDEDVFIDLSEDSIDMIHLKGEEVFLEPGEKRLETDEHILEYIKKSNNYDVFEIWTSGELCKRYDNSSNDNYFFITARCNSNCVMCPSSDYSREHGEDSELRTLRMIAEHIPTNTPHLTVTGGEPFLLGEDIFEFIGFLQKKFTKTEILFLTNGRIFAIKKYAMMLSNSLPNRSIIAIPIHGSCEEVHDRITRAKNSFNQTLIGIKNLIKLGIRVELRLVVSKLNLSDFENLADLIITEIPKVEYISIIAMEMTGNAFLNRDEVWVGYKPAFNSIENAIAKLIDNGISVKLYNFPLCTVKKKYWTLCEKSISPYKVRFVSVCDECCMKSACGGLFAGTVKLEEEEIEPIK